MISRLSEAPEAADFLLVAGFLTRPLLLEVSKLRLFLIELPFADQQFLGFVDELLLPTAHPLPQFVSRVLERFGLLLEIVQQSHICRIAVASATHWRAKIGPSASLPSCQLTGQLRCRDLAVQRGPNLLRGNPQFDRLTMGLARVLM